jgi:hypothetical protein
MAPWIYDEKFLTDMRFLFRTLSFTAGEYDDLEHPAQEQEECRMTMISFEFFRGLKNSATTFQATVRLRLLFIKSHSTSAQISAWSDSWVEPAG